MILLFVKINLFCTQNKFVDLNLTKKVDSMQARRSQLLNVITAMDNCKNATLHIYVLHTVSCANFSIYLVDLFTNLFLLT